MNAKLNCITRFSIILSTLPKSISFHNIRNSLFCTALPCTENVSDKPELTESEKPELTELKNSADVFRKWGVSETDLNQIFSRRPSLIKKDIEILQSRLKILSDIGINSSDLVKIINCRPKFLNSRLNKSLEERLNYLETFLGSNELLLKAILRNPSLLTYDFNRTIKPTLEMYEKVGLTRKDLTSMLLSRPTIISRSSLDEEKMEFIKRTKVCQTSKMYKHVVSLFAVSRTETLRGKIAYLERFGFTEDEVLQLFGRSPLLVSLSTNKVQRNMTFILGVMKLPASTVLNHPFLLFSNLENLLKPRVLLGGKIEDMNLVPQMKGPALLTALRMKEDRFIRAFISVHPEDIANKLMEFYSNAKCIKRLAESSKKNVFTGFPF